MSKSYNTKQKREILNFFEENKESCFCAKDIIEKFSREIGEATVYRCLTSLSEEGIVKKFISEKGQRSFYQYAVCDKCDKHFHMKCVSCGKLIHMDCEFLHSFGEHVKKEHDFHVDNSKTVIYGLCSSCRQE